jgi:hypothetical protein
MPGIRKMPGITRCGGDMLVAAFPPVKSSTLPIRIFKTPKRIENFAAGQLGGQAETT